jgi:hypothetical protein
MTLKMLMLMLLGAASGLAGTIFFDNFNSGASASWSNTYGNWVATNGVYYAQTPPNPPPLTLLPFDLTNFSVDVDVNTATDGGIWLRSDVSGNNALLLVTGGTLAGGDHLYWNLRQGGTYGPGLLPGGSGVQGNNIHVHVDVVGNTYTAYLNGSSTPATTLVDNTFSHGFVGLYDNSAGIYNGHPSASETFDNFLLSTAVPEPASLLLLGGGIAILIRRRSSRGHNSDDR